MSVCLLLALALVAACAAVAMCPPDGSVTADTHAVGCANLRLTIAADNVTLVIEGATGTINVMANAAGTTLGALQQSDHRYVYACRAPGSRRRPDRPCPAPRPVRLGLPRADGDRDRIADGQPNGDGHAERDVNGNRHRHEFRGQHVDDRNGHDDSLNG